MRLFLEMAARRCFCAPKSAVLRRKSSFFGKSAKKLVEKQWKREETFGKLRKNCLQNRSCDAIINCYVYQPIWAYIK